VKYVKEVLPEIMKDVGDKLDLNPHYIIAKDEKGGLNSMHGQPEVDGDLQQICVREKWGIKKWVDYMGCFADKIFNVGDPSLKKDWKYCAGEVGIDADKLGECVEKEAKTFVEKDMEMMNKYQAYSSPTAVFDCTKALAGAIPYSSIKPALCSVVLSDKGIKSCQ
jgi:hypothetical protein